MQPTQEGLIVLPVAGCAPEFSGRPENVIVTVRIAVLSGDDSRRIDKIDVWMSDGPGPASLGGCQAAGDVEN